MSKSDIPSEKAIVKQITEFLKKQPSVWHVKWPAGPRGRAGVPDIICCIRGRFVAFEVKRPTIGKVSPTQERELKAIEKARGFAYVVTNVVQVAGVIRLLGGNTHGAARSVERKKP